MAQGPRGQHGPAARQPANQHRDRVHGWASMLTRVRRRQADGALHWGDVEPIRRQSSAIVAILGCVDVS